MGVLGEPLLALHVGAGISISVRGETGTSRLWICDDENVRQPLMLYDAPQVYPVGRPPRSVVLAGETGALPAESRTITVELAGVAIPGEMTSEAWAVAVALDELLKADSWPAGDLVCRKHNGEETLRRRLASIPALRHGPLGGGGTIYGPGVGDGLSAADSVPKPQ